MGTNSLLLNDLFRYSYEDCFMHGLLNNNEKKLALIPRSFN